jgi:hypothetical protein
VLYWTFRFCFLVLTHSVPFCYSSGLLRIEPITVTWSSSNTTQTFDAAFCMCTNHKSVSWNHKLQNDFLQVVFPNDQAVPVVPSRSDPEHSVADTLDLEPGSIPPPVNQPIPSAIKQIATTTSSKATKSAEVKPKVTSPASSSPANKKRKVVIDDDYDDDNDDEDGDDGTVSRSQHGRVIVSSSESDSDSDVDVTPRAEASTQKAIVPKSSISAPAAASQRLKIPKLSRTNMIVTAPPLQPQSSTPSSPPSAAPPFTASPSGAPSPKASSPTVTSQSAPTTAPVHRVSEQSPRPMHVQLFETYAPAIRERAQRTYASVSAVSTQSTDENPPRRLPKLEQLQLRLAALRRASLDRPGHFFRAMSLMLLQNNGEGALQFSSYLVDCATVSDPCAVDVTHIILWMFHCLAYDHRISRSEIPRQVLDRLRILQDKKDSLIRRQLLRIRQQWIFSTNDDHRSVGDRSIGDHRSVGERRPASDFAATPASASTSTTSMVSSANVPRSASPTFASGFRPFNASTTATTSSTSAGTSMPSYGSVGRAAGTSAAISPRSISPVTNLPFPQLSTVAPASKPPPSLSTSATKSTPSARPTNHAAPTSTAPIIIDLDPFAVEEAELSAEPIGEDITPPLSPTAESGPSLSLPRPVGFRRMRPQLASDAVEVPITREDIAREAAAVTIMSRQPPLPLRASIRPESASQRPPASRRVRWTDGTVSPEPPAEKKESNLSASHSLPASAQPLLSSIPFPSLSATDPMAAMLSSLPSLS